MRCPLLARILVDNSVGQIHTSCQPVNPAAISLFPNQTTIDSILKLHNNARQIVYPTSSSLTSLQWDFRLARLAQSRSNQCMYAPDCARCRVPLNNQTINVGQNSFTQIYGQFDWISAVSAWIGERNIFYYGSGSITGDWEDVGK